MTSDMTKKTNSAPDYDMRIYEDTRNRKDWFRNPESFTRNDIIKEIGVFLIITFGLMMSCWWFAYPNGEIFSEKTGVNMLFYYLATFSPAIGCIATRYIFHEGFKDDILFPEFTGHFKGYFLSILLPIVFGISNCILMTIATGAGFSVKAVGGTLEVTAGIALYSINAYIAFFILIGEELGWRAFLYDKLERLLGFHGSIIIGGIIWGLWHIPPLIGSGLNFGKEAPGFPITNILLMCVFCIFSGAMIQMVRKMTDSVIAAIIAHAVIDTICNPLAAVFLSEKSVEGKTFQIGFCMVVSAMIIGIPCWIYMSRRYGKTPSKIEEQVA